MSLRWIFFFLVLSGIGCAAPERRPAQEVAPVLRDEPTYFEPSTGPSARLTPLGVETLRTRFSRLVQVHSIDPRPGMSEAVHRLIEALLVTKHGLPWRAVQLARLPNLLLMGSDRLGPDLKVSFSRLIAPQRSSKLYQKIASQEGKVLPLGARTPAATHLAPQGGRAPIEEFYRAKPGTVIAFYRPQNLKHVRGSLFELPSAGDLDSVFLIWDGTPVQIK